MRLGRNKPPNRPRGESDEDGPGPGQNRKPGPPGNRQSSAITATPPASTVPPKRLAGQQVRAGGLNGGRRARVVDGEEERTAVGGAAARELNALDRRGQREQHRIRQAAGPQRTRCRRGPGTWPGTRPRRRQRHDASATGTPSSGYSVKVCTASAPARWTCSLQIVDDAAVAQLQLCAGQQRVEFLHPDAQQLTEGARVAAQPDVVLLVHDPAEVA